MEDRIILKETPLWIKWLIVILVIAIISLVVMIKYNTRNKAVEKKTAVVEKTKAQRDSIEALRDNKIHSSRDYIELNHKQSTKLIKSITDEKPIVITDTTYVAKRKYIAGQVARFEFSGDSK